MQKEALQNVSLKNKVETF